MLGISAVDTRVLFYTLDIGQSITQVPWKKIRIFGTQYLGNSRLLSVLPRAGSNYSDTPSFSATNIWGTPEYSVSSTIDTRRYSGIFSTFDNRYSRYFCSTQYSRQSVVRVLCNIQYLCM
ncbi:unnamed protein product [Sphacelaria rigidula]